MQLIPDERLTDALPTLIYQFPPMIREMLDLTADQNDRQIRLLVFDYFSQLTTKELIIDQITAAQLPELLALAVKLNPPAFQPTDLTPNTLAAQKAYSYCANYLMNRFVRGLTTVGNRQEIVEELTTDAGDVMLAQIQRLQFNYNQHFNVTDYLTDIKARPGLLAAITAKQSAALAGASSEVISLAGQIGQSIGVLNSITYEYQQLRADKDWFIKKINTGQYPLALLFARQNDSTWFNNFFSQVHRPSLTMFDQARQLTLQHLSDVEEIIDDIRSQLRLDIKVLPSAHVQAKLNNLISSI